MIRETKLGLSPRVEEANFSKLPVIDFDDFLHGDASKRKEVTLRIAETCKNVGFFYLVGHGVSSKVISDAFQASADFFSLPEEVKREVTLDTSRPPCSGWFDQVSGSGLANLKESFRMGLLPDDHPSVQAGTPNTIKNQWPSHPKQFKPAFRAYIDALEILSSEILHAIALAIDLPEEYFDEWFTDQMGSLAALHYPPQETTIEQNRIGFGEHSDFGALTILAQDSQGGLQVQTTEGRWIEASPIPGALIVNIGDLMARWTNDLLSSTRHRVVNTSKGARNSIAFFRDPNNNTVIKCIESCIDGGMDVRYPPVTAFEYSMQYYAEIFNMPPDLSGTY